MIKKISLFIVLGSFSSICAMDGIDIWRLLNIWKAYTDHQKFMSNRPNTKAEWESIVDAKIEHLIKTMQPTIDNDDDRNYWEPQMEDIEHSIHYRYKKDDPLANSLSLESNGPLVAAVIIGAAAVISLISKYSARRGGGAAHFNPAPPAYDA